MQHQRLFLKINLWVNVLPKMSGFFFSNNYYKEVVDFAVIFVQVCTGDDPKSGSTL